MTRSRFFAALFLTLLFGGSAAAAAPDNLVGVARTPVGFAGTLTSSQEPWLMTYEVPLKPAASLTADLVRLTVSEQRYSMGLAAARPFVSRDVMGPRTPDVRNLRDFSATLVVATPQTSWHLVGSNRTELAAQAECTFRHSPDWAAAATSALRYTMPEHVGLVRAGCHLSSVTAEGPILWQIWNTTVLLRYVDPTTQAARVEELATGDRVEPNPMVPGAFDRVIRSAIIQSLTPKSVGVWRAQASVSIEAPAFKVVGSLTLPLESQLRWDDKDYREEPVTPAPEGEFRLAPQDGMVAINGRTMNAPAPPSSLLWRVLPAAGGSLGIAVIGALGWALYARLQREDLLAHPARRAVMDHLQQNPGATLKELQSVAPGSRSALLHHLRRLRTEGYIVQRPHGRVMLYAVRADEPRLQDPEFLAQRMKRHELAYLIIAKEPSVSQTELAQRLGVTQSYVSRILSDLIRDGRIERVPGGPRRSYRVVPSVEPKGVSAGSNTQS